MKNLLYYFLQPIRFSREFKAFVTVMGLMLFNILILFMLYWVVMLFANA